ncbi:MAG: LytTR family DNA-binding domain-containing protein, partial [Brumimicrobium sp.]
FILFTARDFHQVFQVKTFLTVALHGMLIGFVPAFIAVLINYTVSLKRNLKEAMVYNQRLLKMLPVDNAINTEDEVCIPSNNKSETIKIIPTQLLYVKSEGNYIELYFEDESKIKKEVYRASIKTIEEALQKYSYIIRTHRCYLVNLQKVKNHKGNARNFQLYFDDSETMVPVSRNNFKSIQDWMGGF